MKGNRISRSNGSVLAMAGRIVHGLRALPPGQEIAGASPDEMQALLMACRNADAAVGAAKATHRSASTTLQKADDDARAFLTKTKATLAIFLGARWHAGWEPTGFPDQCTMIPKRQHKRWNLCKSLETYFNDHPAHVVPEVHATAARCAEHFERIRRDRAACNQALATLASVLKERDAVYEKLRRTIRAAMNYIGMKLAPADARWHSFGLNAPADPHVPGRVAEVTLQPTAPGLLAITWTKAPRATRYRVYVQQLGKDDAPVARPPVYDPRLTLTGLPSGARLRIHILAANATGEAAPSPTVEITLP